MKFRGFQEHLLGIKKTMVVILVCYLLMVVPLIISFNSESSILTFISVIIVITLLAIWWVYFQYADHNRMKKGLIESGIYNYLKSLNFNLLENNTGWNYELSFQGLISDYYIIIGFNTEKGNIWHEYFIQLSGTQQSNLQSSNIKLEHYKDQIKLTNNAMALSDLKFHLNHFIEKSRKL